MKYTITVFAALFVALSVAQWPCHDYGWNGPIANCASCNVMGNVWSGSNVYSVCTNCTNGFFLNQSACLPCAVNCTSCQSNGACKSSGCALGFAFIPTNSTCVACPSTLSCGTCTYNSQGGAGQSYGIAPFSCTTCLNNGYYISSTGACVACATGCSASTGATLATANVYSTTTQGCSASGGCTACAAGYVAVITSGVTACSACAANCQTCTTAGAGNCDTCNTGYGLSGTVCAACSVTGCATCAGAFGTCDSCTTGLWLSANACGTTACTAGCSVCASASTCTTCATGYYMNAAAVTGTCAACAVTNCTTCANWASATSVGGWCTACKANTTLQNGACYACPANCTSCALASSSSTTTVCLQCQLGYGLNDTNGVCVPCPANCDYCDGSGVCTQCRQATWSASTAFFPVVSAVGANQYQGPTIQVTQGYYLPPNQCQQCPYNCSSCANSTFCYSNCTKNYLFNSTTNQCLPNGVERIVFAGFAFLTVIFYFV